MMELLDEQPRGKQDYDIWISDGVALGKGKTNLVIQNSVAFLHWKLRHAGCCYVEKWFKMAAVVVADVQCCPSMRVSY